MNTVSVELTDERYLKLNEKAKELGVPTVELVRISIDDLLRHPDEKLRHIVDEILKENAELYRRLA